MRWDVGQVVWAYRRGHAPRRMTVQRVTRTGRPRTECGTAWSAEGDGPRGGDRYRPYLLTNERHAERERKRQEQEAHAARRSALLAQRSALVAALPSEAGWLAMTDEERAAWMARLGVADANPRD